MSEVIQLHRVTVEQVIRVGGLYTLCGSEAFSGMRTGRVTVRGIYHPDTMDAETRRNTISVWEEYTDEETHAEYLTNEWVLYQHDGDVVHDSFVDVDVPVLNALPISVFASHTVRWV